MIEPTSEQQAYRWYNLALKGVAPIHSEPECGFFKRKLVRGGCYVPVRIWLYSDVDHDTGELLSDEQLQCEVNGEYADPEDQWLWVADHVITIAEYNYLVARRDWALVNDALDPHSNPRAAVNWLSLPIQF